MVDAWVLQAIKDSAMLITPSLIVRLTRWLTTLYDLWLHWQSRWQKDDLWNDLPAWLDSRHHHCIWVATVNYCNARCVFCGQHKFKRPSGVMPMETFKQIAKQAADMGMTEMDFTPPLGDPLLDEHLEERAEYARSLGFKKLDLTTNGILLAKKGRYHRILELFDEIRVSIGGLDAESYHEAYGVDRFDDVWEGLRLMANINAIHKRRIHIFFRSIKTAGEISSDPKFKDLKDCPGVSIEFTNRYDNWGGSVKEPDLIGDMKMRKPPKKSGVPCRGLTHYFVEHQGNVRLCGCRFLDTEDDGLVIGNVNREPLKQILSGARALRVMEKFMDGESDKLPGVCRKCTLYRPITKSFLQQAQFNAS